MLNKCKTNKEKSDIKDFVALPTISRRMISKSLMLFSVSDQILVGD